jgi:hypothetical protein
MTAQTHITVVNSYGVVCVVPIQKPVGDISTFVSGNWVYVQANTKKGHNFMIQHSKHFVPVLAGRPWQPRLYKS